MKTRRVVSATGAIVAVGLLGFALWLAVAPPDTLRIATGYASKTLCSGVFVAGRDPSEMAIDLQAPGNPILKLIRTRVDRDAGVASAAFLGLFAHNQAVHREGLGCATASDGNVDRIIARAPLIDVPALPRDEGSPWPVGSDVGADFDPAVMAVLADDSLAGPGMRAVVVVKDGRIVAERYGAGITAETPLLGWSMTKSVTAILIGLALDRFEGLDEANLFPTWTDARAEITLADLLGMKSGLGFNEDYGSASDVNRMLFLEPDMASFAERSTLVAPPGTVFNYSSGTSVLVARLLQNRLGGADEAQAWPRKSLFVPLGMNSAVMEADASGTFVGSSYLYATGRDWARLGLFLVQDGRWGEAQLLPPGFVDWMTAPDEASDGVYGQGQVWRQPRFPGPDIPLPADTYWFLGHDGQAVTIVPSHGLVVVRLGITPRDLDYSPSPLIAAILAVRPGDADRQEAQGSVANGRLRAP